MYHFGRDVDKGGRAVSMWGRGYGKSLYLPLNFASNLRKFFFVRNVLKMHIHWYSNPTSRDLSSGNNFSNAWSVYVRAKKIKAAYLEMIYNKTFSIGIFGGLELWERGFHFLLYILWFLDTHTHIHRCLLSKLL